MNDRYERLMPWLFSTRLDALVALTQVGFQLLPPDEGYTGRSPLLGLVYLRAIHAVFSSLEGCLAKS